MNCTHHPEVAAAGTCAGCAEPFCWNCLVEIQGQKYCASCKVMTVAGSPPPDAGTIPCELASQALRYAIFGIFCFGIILEPVAIAKASKAKRLIQEDPRLSGSGKVTATYVIAIAVLILWVVGFLARVGSGVRP